MKFLFSDLSTIALLFSIPYICINLRSLRMLEIETQTFEQQLPGLLLTDPGKFVLIKGSEITGIFSAVEDALKTGYEKFGADPFFIRQILPAQQPLNFANNYLVA